MMKSPSSRSIGHANRLLLEQLARVAGAAGHPVRVKLLNLLCQGEKPVEWLADQTEQSIASASAHLKVLKSAGLVVARKQGRQVLHCVASASVPRLWLLLRELAEELLPEAREAVREHFDSGPGLLRLTPQEVLAGVAEGQFILLDVRPDDEYRAGHLPGAVSVPSDELIRRLAQLPPGEKLVLYCRGPYCVTAVETVDRLRAGGLDAWRLPLGVGDWRAAGLELETVPAANVLWS